MVSGGSILLSDGFRQYAVDRKERSVILHRCRTAAAIAAIVILFILPITVHAAERAAGADPHAAPDPTEVNAVTQVRDNLYRFTTSRGRALHASLFLVTGEGIILTDPIRTSGALWLRDELKRRFNKPVKYVIYSHAHFDHIGGGQVFQKDGAMVIAHENAVDPIVGEKLPTAVPNKIFKDRMTVELGGDVVKLTRVAPSHSNSMIVIEFPRQRTVMAVDFCPVNGLPYNDLPDFYYDGWMESLEYLNTLDFDILEGGHLELGTKANVALNIEYMRSLHDQVLMLIREGQPWDQLSRNVKIDQKFRNWAYYDERRVLNILGMYRWVSGHRRGIW
jgi:glyoxylase-like metal-dependent hydrolase (beta-lactamase superfamily II)